MNRAVPKRSRGFTLVELLVAILILSLFMTASMGAVRVAGKSLNAAQQRADATGEMRAVADFLRRQFAQLPRLTHGEGKDKRLVFSADATNVLFVAPATKFSHGVGLMTYWLAGEEGDGEQLLTLRYAPFDPGAEELFAPERGERIVLARGFDEVAFRYYGAPTDDARVEWLDAWQSDAEQLPRAIHLRTRSELADNSGWPDLVFSLRSGGGR